MQYEIYIGNLSKQLTSDCLRNKRGMGASADIFGLRRANFDNSSIGSWTSAGSERRLEISDASILRFLVLGLRWTLQSREMLDITN